MSKVREKKGPTIKPVVDQTGDYRIGYGKPPVETRFKKGQSGNPRGRPPRPRNIEALTEAQLDQVVAIDEAGKRRHVSKRELGIIVLVKKALAGNPRAIRILYKMMRKLDPRPPAPSFRVAYVDDNGDELSAKRLEELLDRTRPPGS
jgi:hypothetical protein